LEPYPQEATAATDADQLPPSRPRVWPIFTAWAAAQVGLLVLSALVGLAWAIATAIRHPGMPAEALRRAGDALVTSPWFLSATAGSSAAVLGAVALVGAKRSRERVGERLRFGRSGLSGVQFIAAVVGFSALGEACSAFVVMARIPVSGSLAWMTRALAGAKGPSLACAVLTVGLLAGLAEELFFRGFMQVRLRERFGPWAAVLVTAAAFGISHLNLLHAAMAFLMGLYAGWLLERTGSIRPGILGHAANNTLCILLTSAYPAGAEQALGAGRCLAVTLAVLVACIAIVNRPSPAEARRPGRPPR